MNNAGVAGANKPTDQLTEAEWDFVQAVNVKGVFFCNSGAEANEGAIKLARKYSFDKYGAGRSDIGESMEATSSRAIVAVRPRENISRSVQEAALRGQGDGAGAPARRCTAARGVRDSGPRAMAEETASTLVIDPGGRTLPSGEARPGGGPIWES